MRNVCRFAPSTTGPAHPGTLLAGLLAWLDARSRKAHFVLRLEDLDPDRAQQSYFQSMLEDLEWFGLDWDELDIQSENRERHEQALDHLASLGVLYPCSMSRAEIKRHGVRAPNGGFAYPNTNRTRTLPDKEWRKSQEPLRARIPDQIFSPDELSTLDLSQNPATEMGDPVVRRRDGAIAYNLAAVMDDDTVGVNHIVRGHDIASSTATQLALMKLLNVKTPTYRHHFLLLEPRGEKLAKLHGSIGAPTLKPHYQSPDLCGFLAHIAGICTTPSAITPQELLKDFDWQKVRQQDVVVQWDEATHLLSWKENR